MTICNRIRLNEIENMKFELNIILATRNNKRKKSKIFDLFFLVFNNFKLDFD